MVHAWPYNGTGTAHTVDPLLPSVTFPGPDHVTPRRAAVSPRLARVLGPPFRPQEGLRPLLAEVPLAPPKGAAVAMAHAQGRMGLALFVLGPPTLARP